MLKSLPFKKLHMKITFKTVYRKCIESLPKTKTFDNMVSLLFFIRTHRRLPKRIDGGLNDCLYYLKTTGELSDPLRVFVTDKEFVKEYIKRKVGAQYNVPTLGVVHSYDEALTYSFPPECVIKPTHMSGPVLFRRNNEPVDLEAIKEWFGTNYYYFGREPNYRDLRPKLIIEPFIFGEIGPEDYKIICVRGKPGLIQLDLDRYGQHTRNVYDTNWKIQPFSNTYPIGKGIKRPDKLEEMLHIASVLSQDFNLMRVDVYTDGKEILVGELTNCHGNATERYLPAPADDEVARMLFGERGFSTQFLEIGR
jgi:hypothetical protein